MKNFLLLAILALSINAYSQNKPINLQPLHNQHSFSSVPHMVKGEEGKIPGLFPREKSGKTDRYGLNELMTLIPIFDSIYTWAWDTSINNWILDTKSVDISYDAHYNPTSLTTLSWTGSAWENVVQATFTYDANSNQTGFVYRSWNGIAWQNVFQLISVYDANNNLTSETYQSWNGVAWVNASKFIYTYDGNNNLLNELDQSWNVNAWENDYQYTYTYDANNNQTSETDQNWNGSAWENTEQYLGTYDASNNLVTSNHKIWNGSAWDEISLSTYTYDGNNNQTSRTDQYWDGVSWVNYSKVTYTYNGSNNVTHSLTQLWNGFDWGDSDQSIYTYNSHQNLIRQVNQTWGGASWLNVSLVLGTYDEDGFLEGESTKNFDSNGVLVIDGDSTRYYFHSVVATHDLLMDENINVFPNPSEGKITISSKTEMSSLEIFNLLGERIYSDYNLSLQGQKEIDLTAFGHGFYFIWISNGQLMYNRKIVIQ